MKKNRFISFLLLCLVCLSLNSKVPEYGLYIQTFPERRTDFTSMTLDGGKPIELSGKELTMNFKVWNRDENTFGTVFRILTDKGQNIDLMYSVNEAEEHHPILVLGDEVHSIQQAIKHDEWLDVQLTLSPQKGTVSLTYDNQSIGVEAERLRGIRHVRIAFGYCPFEGYSLGNVASINLKDIHLSKDGKVIRQWEMAAHQEDTCYDLTGNQPAIGENTRWLIDDHFTWKKIYSRDFSSPPSLTFAPDSGTFYILTQPTELQVFQPEHFREDTLVLQGTGFISGYSNQLQYIPQGHKLLVYYWDENRFSSLDLKTLQWESNQPSGQTPNKQHYWNSSQLYNPQDSSLLSFGGYGHFLYNNDLLIKYPYRTDTLLTKRKLTSIHPRFTAASTLVDRTLYLFGGYGCPSGKSVLSPRHYYDLYAVHLDTGQTDLIWELSETPEDGSFVPGENMVYDAQNDCFYVFSTQQGGTLLKIDRQQPVIEPMSLPLYQALDAQFIYTNLYYSSEYNKLYTAILQTVNDAEAHLDIYELDYPPSPINCSKQYIVTAEQKALLPYLIVGILIVTALVYGLHIYHKRPKEKKEQVSDSSAPTPPENPHYPSGKQTICLLGGFRVIDREGHEITMNITPTLQSLLILLILHTAKDPKGIASRQLLQTLWPDKPEDSAKNNCYVYMSKLRNLLSKVGDITIQNKNSFWSIHFKDDSFCDYLEVCRLYQKKDSPEELETLMDLLLRGMMLPDLEADWIDKFKNDFSNNTINLLIQILKRDDLSDECRLKIADTLFQHDYLNEEALAEKCNILYQQGKKGLAKTVYDTFCKEYESSLGTPYATPLTAIIKRTEVHPH